MAATTKSSPMQMFKNRFSKGGGGGQSSGSSGRQSSQSPNNTTYTTSGSSPPTIHEEEEHNHSKPAATATSLSNSNHNQMNNSNHQQMMQQQQQQNNNGQQQQQQMMMQHQSSNQQVQAHQNQPQSSSSSTTSANRDPFASHQGPQMREASGGGGGGGGTSMDDSGRSTSTGSMGSMGKKAGSFMMKKSSVTGKGTRGSMSYTPSSQTGNPGGTSSSRSKKTSGRRAIRASAFVVDEPTESANYSPPIIPKSDSAKRLIYNAIRNNVLFKACSNDELKDLIDAFSTKHTSKGAIVIQEGAQGDGFYVLSNGAVSVYETTEFKGTLHPGMGFGEIALLYSCPRTATVRAREECDLWFMDRRAFRAIMARHKRKRLNMKLMLLEKVKIHDKTLGEILKPHEVHSVAMAAQFKEYTQGQVIVRQGDVGDAFYMIEKGSVDVYIREKSETHPVVTLKAGAFFGEKALLSSDVRTATCVASASGESEVKCILLMREDFVRMLGDLEYLLERSYEGREGSDRSGRDGKLPGDGGGNLGIDTMVHPLGEKFIKDDFDIKRTLGVGAYGFVKLVRWNRAPPAQDNFYYALKCVSKQKIEEKKQQLKIKREEDIMKSLVHPFIARCYNVMEDVKGKYFLMEALCGGELCELLYFENKFSEDWSMFYSASVLAAFAHMHERKVAYRDLKPENLVLDNLGYVKIVDFGLAKVIKNGQTYTFCGTPDYLAPEVILSEGHDWAVDYWGLGVLIYEMTEGVAPFYAENPMDTYRKALSGQVHIPDHFTVVVANLIKKLLHTDQSKRLGRTVGGTTAIMCHRWFANFDWDSLLDYSMESPYIPEKKDPDHYSASDMDGDVEGFASDFL